MSTVNCYVCNRGFPDIDLLYAHLGEHPGRTVEEMSRAAEAWGRLKGTDREWMLREAEHNDEHEVSTAIPGFAVNDAMAQQSNREKAAAVGAKGKAARLNRPHGVEKESEVETPTPLTFVDGSPVSEAEWAEHDAHAEAQRKPYSEMAQDYAARHLYKAREIPHYEAVGLHRNAEYARREDAAEDEVRAEREAGLEAMRAADEALAHDGMVKRADGTWAFNTALADTAATRRAFLSHKQKLMAERAAESAAMFREQFPEEAKEAGVKAPKLTKAQRAAIDRQKADAKRATQQAIKATAEQTTSPQGTLSQVNEPVAETPVKTPEPPPERVDERTEEGR